MLFANLNSVDYGYVFLLQGRVIAMPFLAYIFLKERR